MNTYQIILLFVAYCLFALLLLKAKKMLQKDKHSIRLFFFTILASFLLGISGLIWILGSK